MFRGVLFMVDGKMCISTGDNELMCRIDPAIHDEVLKRSGCKTTIMKGHAYRGYVYVNEDGMTTEEDFNFWIERSLEFNIIAKASPKKKKQD